MAEARPGGSLDFGQGCLSWASPRRATGQWQRGSFGGWEASTQVSLGQYVRAKSLASSLAPYLFLPGSLKVSSRTGVSMLLTDQCCRPGLVRMLSYPLQVLTLWLCLPLGHAEVNGKCSQVSRNSQMKGQRDRDVYAAVEFALAHFLEKFFKYLMMPVVSFLYHLK